MTLLALVLLLGVVWRVKGRSLSSAERIEIQFKDINGMRPGAGVQMMGLKVGQVEEITPVVAGENSYVTVKFVITTEGIKIPNASMFSIQQSGLIGELFLEITPPKTRTLYLPVVSNKDLLFKDDVVEMKLDDSYFDVGNIKNIEIIARDAVPHSSRDYIKTNHAYKVDYIVDLPGLILPEFMKGTAIQQSGNSKLRITTLDEVTLPYPKQTSPYTVIEPMRLADFLDWQYKAAESLTETNRKVNDLLSDDVIAELKASVVNINDLTSQASGTMAKLNELIDDSRGDIKKMMELADQATTDFNKLSKNINTLIGDPSFRKDLNSATTSMASLSDNLNKIMGDTEQSKQMAADIRASMHNINEISKFVNTLTKDDQLKKDLTRTVNNLNNTMVDISTTLDTVNRLTPESKTELQKIMDDTAVTTCNLRKFSEKLNKRFLLFRLMF